MTTERTRTERRQEEVPTAYGIFLPDGGGKPVAIFADADKATAARYALDPTGNSLIKPSDDLDEVNDDVKLYFESMASPEVRPANASAEIFAGEVRTAERKRILAEEIGKESEDDIRKSIQAEMKAEKEAKEKQEKDAETARQDREQDPDAYRATANTSAIGPGTTGATTEAAIRSGGSSGTVPPATSTEESTVKPATSTRSTSQVSQSQSTQHPASTSRRSSED